jgi:hypothetical protein
VVCEDACRVSGAAKLHQVKVPSAQEFESRRPRSIASAKRKKPGIAGLFDEYLFQSVHFASFAI